MKGLTLPRLTCFLLPLLLAACGEASDEGVTFTVVNNLDLERTDEVIGIPVADIDSLIQAHGAENLTIRDGETDSVLVSQAVDNDGDGQADEILFQVSLPANGQKPFTISGGGEQADEPERRTFSRFVPERIDDYTWENDRVAFRTYGPVAQQITESGQPGGTLSSGIDCWLKRVEYPIIDKWYQANTKEAGAYHIDTGEGYDPYHVGSSRGCGGIGVRAGDTLYVSKNFTGYRTLTKGPLRTVFELTYAPWPAGGDTIREVKRISLDLGSQLSRFEEQVSSSSGAVPNYAVGLTLHKQEGEVRADTAAGWFRYWEPVDTTGQSMMGVGIVIEPGQLRSFEDYRTDTPDQSQLFVFPRVNDGRFVYYAGFGWDKAGRITSAENWDSYLRDFARRLRSPLEIRF